jgi:hypothetical protein
LVELWGEKRSAEREESVGDGAESGVVVKASPGATLEMVESKLLLELLVVALDSPAQSCEPNEGETTAVPDTPTT